MRTIGLSMTLLLGLALAPAAYGADDAAPAVALTAEPSHHLLLENDQVRVFRFDLAPHASTLLHRHGHDYVFVTLGDAHFSNEVQGKAPVEVTLPDGKTGFTPGDFAHRAKNLADTPFRNLTIELLQDDKLRAAPSPWPPEAEGNRDLPGVRIRVLSVKDGVRVSEVEVQPGATIPRHHHNGPHLVVAVNDLELRSEVAGKGPVATTLKAGDARWIPGDLTHTLTNTGKSPARMVTVEFAR